MIVAVDEHRFHQPGGRPAADGVVQGAAAMLNLGEIIGGDRDLDGARHREWLVAVDADQFAAAQVERGDADIPGGGGDQRGKLIFERAEARRRSRPGGLGDEGQKPAEDRNKPHALPALTPSLSAPNA